MPRRDQTEVQAARQAQLGAFITLQPATRDMQKETVSAGFYESQFGNFPRLQILTIEELLDGKKLLYPHMNVATFKRAERQTKTQQPELFQAQPASRQTPLHGGDFSGTLLLDEMAEDVDADA